MAFSITQNREISKVHADSTAVPLAAYFLTTKNAAKLLICV
jgi:hypothetical protein